MTIYDWPPSPLNGGKHIRFTAKSCEFKEVRTGRAMSVPLLIRITLYQTDYRLPITKY